MSWVLAIGLAGAALLAMLLIFRVPRAAGTAIASSLVLGLAGYALQANPGLPGAPKLASAAVNEEGPLIVSARRRFFAQDIPLPGYMIMADGFTRRGQFADAVALLRGGLRDHPQDAEGWVALGNALVGHANGALSPPAQAAFAAAQRADPGTLAPGFFTGIAELRAGRLIEAHQAWSATLAQAPADAPGRAEVEQRRDQLGQLMRRLAEQ